MGEIMLMGVAVGFGWFFGAMALENWKRSKRRKRNEMARAERKKAHVCNHEDFKKYI